jgi:hypothetical protein
MIAGVLETGNKRQDLRLTKRLKEEVKIISLLKGLKTAALLEVRRMTAVVMGRKTKDL